MSNLKIGFKEDSYNSKIEFINTAAQIFFDAEKELENQKAKDIKAESLTNGNFVKALHEYHKSQYEKSSYKNDGISFEKFLNLLEVNTSELEKLEERFKAYQSRTIDLYEVNTDFYQYCELNKMSNHKLKAALEKAPTKKSYSVFDLFEIKGNKVKIDLPRKPFEIHAMDKTQIQLMHDVTDFISKAKALELKYNEVNPLIKKYLRPLNPRFGDTPGLSTDLNTIVFDYQKVLSFNI